MQFKSPSLAYMDTCAHSTAESNYQPMPTVRSNTNLTHTLPPPHRIRSSAFGSFSVNFRFNWGWSALFLYCVCVELLENVLVFALTLDHCVVAFLRIGDALQRAVRELLVVAVRVAARRVRAAVAQVHVVHVHAGGGWLLQFRRSRVLFRAWAGMFCFRVVRWHSLGCFCVVADSLSLSLVHSLARSLVLYLSHSLALTLGCPAVYLRGSCLSAQNRLCVESLACQYVNVRSASTTTCGCVRGSVCANNNR